jgi:two-component system response regulator RegX3
MSERILIVEDEQAIAEAVEYALENEGFQVDAVDRGADALEAAERDAYDLLVLDLMLPDLSGIEVCRRIRGKSAVPILVLTAKDAEVDRVLGLEVGADDYVTKPFSMVELVARVRSILRRRQLDSSERNHVLDVGDLHLDLSRHEARIGGRPVHLTVSELKLLALLAGDPNRAFTRREIMEALWDSSFVGDARACDIHVGNVRRKIEEDPASPKRLVTVRGVGYRLHAV